MRYLTCACVLLGAQAAAAETLLLDRINAAVAAAPECGFEVNRERVAEATRLAATAMASRQAVSSQPAKSLAPSPAPPPPPPPAPMPEPEPAVPPPLCDQVLAQFGPAGTVFADLVAEVTAAR